MSGWTRESEGRQVRGGWTDELMYLVSVGVECVCVGVECVCVKGSLVLVFGPGLDSMSPARSRRSAAGTHGWLPPPPKNWVDTICTVPPTVAHQPRAGCIHLVLQSNVETGLLHVIIADHKTVFCINNDSELLKERTTGKILHDHVC